MGTPNIVDSDVFPPARAQAPDTSIFLPYITEDIAFEEEYEEYLSDMGWSDSESTWSDGPLFAGGTSAWHRLPAFASEMADGISDSESIVSIGDLGVDTRLDTGRDDDRDTVDENLNNWEVCSARFFAVMELKFIFEAHESKNHGRFTEVACRCSALKLREWAPAGSTFRT